MKNLTGKKYGRLTAIKPERTNYNVYGWLCECECGNTTVVETHKLISGHTKSCGCLQKEIAVKNGKQIKHGLTYENGKITRLYRIWSCMKTRCTNLKDEHFPYYGGRGITICDEWEKYENFYEWAMHNGYGDKLSIDRIDVNGNYEPNNCRWVTVKEQNRNKRNTVIVEYGSENLTLKEVSNRTKINYQTLYYHHKQGDLREYLINYL